MSATYNVITVSSTATLIVPSNPGRNFLFIQNVGATTVYFGMDANVTTSTYAFTLFPQAQMQISGGDQYGSAWYGVTGSTGSVSYGDVGQ